jgi:hypothetical protein
MLFKFKFFLGIALHAISQYHDFVLPTIVMIINTSDEPHVYLTPSLVPFLHYAPRLGGHEIQSAYFIIVMRGNLHFSKTYSAFW